MVRNYCLAKSLFLISLVLPLAAQTVSISPATFTLRIDSTKQFSSSISGNGNKAVTWSVLGATTGTVSNTGLYTPPAELPTEMAVKVRATSVADKTKFAEATVTLQNPIPTITSVAPTDLNIGSHTLILTGTKYKAGATIKLQGTAVATAFISSTELRASVNLPNPQQYCVVVANPRSGGDLSPQRCFNVMAAVSVNISPDTPNIRGGSTRLFTASVRNTPDKTVDWLVNNVAGGSAATGTIAADGTYTAPWNIAAVGGTVKVGVRSKKDPAATAEATVTLQNPVPVISSIVPAVITLGTTAFAIAGSGFAPGATVKLGGVPMTATVVAHTRLEVTGIANAAPGGIAALTVSNIAPAASTSAPKIVNLSPPGAKVTYIAAKRFLEQATWGASPAEIARLMSLGFDDWFVEQRNLAGSDYTMPTGLFGSRPVYEMQADFFTNAMTKRDQLRQRVAFSLHKILVVSANDVTTTRGLVPYQRTLLNNALGNYGSLLKEITLDVAMGQYLDMVNNDKANPATGTQPNENYAREVMQLFTIGTQVLTSAAPTYTQDDIQNLARVFTGWTYPPGRGRGSNNHNNENYGSPLVAVESNHDTGPKTVLGVAIPPGQTASQDLDSALKILFEHPNVGPFIALRLIQSHVTSNPSPAYLGRVVAAFNGNGGPRGDLFNVIKAVLLDPEARAGGNASGHLREPILYTLHLLKALDGTLKLSNPLEANIENMGQKVFYPASVFSYFSPLSRVPGSPELYGPEYQGFTPVTALERVNYVDYLLKSNWLAEARPDIAPYIALASDVDSLLAAIDLHFLNGAMPDVLKQGIRNTLATTMEPTQRARLALYLALSSAYYQIQN